MSKRSLFSLIGVLMLLASATPAMTAPEEEWHPPVVLSDWQASVIDWRLEAGEDGTLAAFWLAQNSSGQWALWARVRPPDKDWGPAANLSGWNGSLAQESRVPLLGTPTHWDAGVRPDGSIVAIWVAVDSAQVGDNLVVRAAHRPPGGGWQDTALSNGYETSVRWADLNIGPEGHMAVAWVACASSAGPATGPCHVRVRRTPEGAETWLPVEHADKAFAGEGITEAYVLVGPGGLTTILWLQADTSTTAKWAVMARSFSPEPAPGAWEPNPHSLSGWKKHAELSAPVTDPGGTVTATWNTFAPDGTNRANYASTRAANSGTWSGAVAISAFRSGFRLYAPQLAAGQDGTVVAVWVYRAVASESYLQANVRDPGSVWGTEAELDGRTSLLFGDVGLGVWPDGSTIVLYSLLDNSRPKAEDERLRWTARGPRGAWGDLGQDDLTDWVAGVGRSDLALGGDGSAVAAWVHEDAGRPSGQEHAVFAATWSPGGPFGQPVQVTEWSGYTFLQPGSAAAVGRDGQPVALLWKWMRANPFGEAVFFSELITTGNLVYVPLGLHRSP